MSGNNTGTDYRSTTYTCTSNSYTSVDNTTAPTISVSSVSGNNINFSHTNLTGTYTPAYTSYLVNGTNHYWYDDRDHNSAPTVSTLSPTYTWSMTGTNASIDANGVVTFNGTPSGNYTVTLTTSNTTPQINRTATLNFSAQAVSENTTTSYSDISVTPASATLDLEGTQTFAVSNTVTETTATTPAHTKITVDGNDYYYYNNSLNASTPSPTTTNTTLNLSSVNWADGNGAAYYTLAPYYSDSSNEVTLTRTAQKSDANHSYTITATVNYGGKTLNLTASATVTIPATYVDLEGISCPDVSVPFGETQTLVPNTWINGEGAKYVNITYTVADPTVATVDENGVVTALKAGTTTVTLQTKKLDGTNGVSCTANITVAPASLPAPTISIDSSTGVATLTDNSGVTGATIRYTTDGTEPTASTATTVASGGTVTLTRGQTIMAIVTVDGGNYSPSAVTSDAFVETGAFGDVVYLDDREDHKWSYYSDASTPAQLHSLNPADVKITYYGDGIMMTGNADYTASSTEETDYIVKSSGNNYVGGAKVNVGGEDENTFIYYKTLERENADGSGRCPYKPIPNPFQVRPTYGGDATTNTADWAGWRGFQCWRLKSVTGGSVYAAASGGTALTTGAVINAETEIYFAPSAEYGMEVQLEAVWAIAYVVKTNTTDDDRAIGDHSSVGCERNFIVLNTTNASYNFGGNSGKRITNIDRQVTVTRYLPNGVRGQNNDATYIRGEATSYNLTLQANTKFENVAFNMGSNTLTANNHDLIIGRGCTGTINNLQGINGNVGSAQNPSGLDYTMRVESGTVSQLAFVRDGGTNSSYTVYGRVLVKSILGSDYDRAKKDNEKLSVSYNNTFFFVRAGAFASNFNKDQKVFDCVVKSGEYQKNFWDSDENNFTYTNSMYCGQNFNATTNTHYPGARYVTIEGGALVIIFIEIPGCDKHPN